MEHFNFKTGFYDNGFLAAPGHTDSLGTLGWSDLQDEKRLDLYKFYNWVFGVSTAVIGFSCWIGYLLLRNY